MTKLTYLFCSLSFYWRTHLALCLGVIVGTAVLSGALIVGDSVRHSLQNLTLERLGDIDHALISQRFFKEDLAEQLSKVPDVAANFSVIAPVLSMQGGLTSGEADHRRRVGQVSVWGVDERFWKFFKTDIEVPAQNENDIVINRRVADQLGIEPADVGTDKVKISLWVELPSAIPRESLMGERETVSREVELNVTAILDDADGLSRFGRDPSQQLPLNAFVSLKTLQVQLDLSEVRPNRRDPRGRPARVNSLYVSAKAKRDSIGPDALNASAMLTASLSKALTLEDLGLQLRIVKDRNYVAIESEQMILDDVVVEAVQHAIMRVKRSELSHTGWNNWQSPVLVYLANELVSAKDPHKFSMYSVVAGFDLNLGAPFGPREIDGDVPLPTLDSREIILNSWLAEDLGVAVGDDIRMKYHTVGSHGELPEQELTFTVAGIGKLEGTILDDRGFTPDIRGITDADQIADWKQPFPMNFDRITERDDEYWEKFKATPKAFVSLKTAQELWSSRYGRLTSYRLAPRDGQSLDEFAKTLETELLASLEPERLNLVFQPLKALGLQAAAGTTDFSGLFIGFSFFLIISAMLLLGLLFRLGIDSRGREVGLLLAIGFTPKQVRNLLLLEGVLVMIVGIVVGTAAAVGYAEVMIYGLKTWWIGAIGTRFLNVFISPPTLVMGASISAVVALLTILWALRELKALSARELLGGNVRTFKTDVHRHKSYHRHRRWALYIGGSCAVFTIAAILGVVPDQEAFSGFSMKTVVFFLVGIGLLTASLLGLSAWMESDQGVAVRGKGAMGILRLSLRNASRHRQRSIMTIGLIAATTFLITAVAAGKRNPAVEKPDIDSGNGGYTLVAQSSSPLLFDLNTVEGRKKMRLDFPADSPEGKLLAEMKVMAFRMLPGEDASCLNLYQTQRPTLLGVPKTMIERNGFKFADTPGDNPWLLLLTDEKSNGGKGIPVLGDMNTLMYSLHKGIGKTLDIPDSEQNMQTLLIRGMFDGSIFQGMLLLSEENFRGLYPEQSGYQYFLIEIPPAKAQELTELLESRLVDFGFDVERIADRLSNFLAVQNTYLSTFQTLGGLGLLLGTFGLGTVMLRNIIERRGELALLRSVGMTPASLAGLVLVENAFLLTCGLIAGTISALCAMLPHLLSTGADVPWTGAGVLLTSVFVVGMLAAWGAIREATRAPIIQALRAE
ncbi:MAG: ABC transporter permease [Planctomycetota bacterium]|nr:ABC transporter permease [Planctomycetota bacterium]MDA1211384.1 ABC transporter permease [Planctomycetota bacterium]